MKKPLFIACAALALAVAACGGAVASGGASPTATPVAQTTSSSAASAATATAATTTSATAKVSANNATQSEVLAALTAAGVPNPSNWTREVLEYRPYPTNDPTFAKLRGELAKYNPAAGVVDKIISALSLP
ncbi:MAG: hypothetical protein M3T56_19955 [Chloroflexota bacterium]|nr:hypothetical protein [Chloroflexota bacterium]